MKRGVGINKVKGFSRIKFILLFVFSLVVASGIVSAVECGAVPTDGCDVTQNTTFDTGTYNLPNGIYILSSSIVLNCNESTLDGSGGSNNRGIDISQGNHDSNTITNCEISNYNYGIYLDGAASPNDPDFNLIINNVLKNNTRGVQLAHDVEYNTVMNNDFINNTIGIYFYVTNPNLPPKYNNITQNIIEDNYQKGIHTLLYSSNNNIWNNKFINNLAHATDDGTNNSWNVSGQGNYWDDYDSEAEGCYDIDSNLICDTPRNISGSAGSKDYLSSTGIQINEIIPVQVIKDVDMVKGKTTLVRSVLKNTGTSDKEVTVNLYFESSLKDTNSSAFVGAGEEINVDLWFVPDSAGNDKEIKIEVLEN